MIWVHWADEGEHHPRTPSTESKDSEYDQREEEMNIMQVNLVKLHQELNGNVEEYEHILVNLKKLFQ